MRLQLFRPPCLLASSCRFCSGRLVYRLFLSSKVAFWLLCPVCPLRYWYDEFLPIHQIEQEVFKVIVV